MNKDVTLKIDIKLLLERLAAFERDQQEVAGIWADLRGALPEKLTPDYLTLVLDLFGVPPDNSLELGVDDLDPDDPRPDNWFCRDSSWDYWHDFIEGRKSVDDLICDLIDYATPEKVQPDLFGDGEG